MTLTKTFKIISYCDIPEELTEKHWISEFMNGCYVEYTVAVNNQKELDKYILEEYEDIVPGETILIDIDY